MFKALTKVPEASCVVKWSVTVVILRVGVDLVGTHMVGKIAKVSKIHHLYLNPRSRQLSNLARDGPCSSSVGNWWRRCVPKTLPVGRKF